MINNVSFSTDTDKSLLNVVEFTSTSIVLYDTSGSKTAMWLNSKILWDISWLTVIGIWITLSSSTVLSNTSNISGGSFTPLTQNVIVVVSV